MNFNQEKFKNEKFLIDAYVVDWINFYNVYKNQNYLINKIGYIYKI